MPRIWAVVPAIAILFLLTGQALDGLTGLTRSIVSGDFSGALTDSRRVESISVADVPVIGRGGTVVWDGFWEVAEGAYDLRLESNGRSIWKIDNAVAVLAVNGVAERKVWLKEGFHHLEVLYDIDAAQPLLAVAAARAGQPPTELNPSSLKPRLPRNPRLRALTRAVHWMAGGATLLTLALAARAKSAAGGRRPSKLASRSRGTEDFGCACRQVV